MSSVEIARATARQNAISPYLDHLRLARLDTDQRQMKGSDEWVDNVTTWVQTIAFLAGQNDQYKGYKLTEVENKFTDLLLLETAAALSTGAHYPKLRSRILEHATEWSKFLEYVNSTLATDIGKYTSSKA